MSRSFILKIARRSILCATLASGLFVTAQRQTQGAGEAAARRRGAEPRYCDETNPGIATDFSGREYKGTLTYRGQRIDGDAVLSVNGDMTFTLTAGGRTLEKGRLTSETTCGYTAVALKSDPPPRTDLTKPPPPAGAAVSLRACNEGGRLSLRAKETGAFDFEKGALVSGVSLAPGGPAEWGRCNGRARLHGDRPW